MNLDYLEQEEEADLLALVDLLESRVHKDHRAVRDLEVQEANEEKEDQLENQDNLGTRVYKASRYNDIQSLKLHRICKTYRKPKLFSLLKESRYR